MRDMKKTRRYAKMNSRTCDEDTNYDAFGSLFG